MNAKGGKRRSLGGFVDVVVVVVVLVSGHVVILVVAPAAIGEIKHSMCKEPMAFLDEKMCASIGKNEARHRRIEKGRQTE